MDLLNEIDKGVLSFRNVVAAGSNNGKYAHMVSNSIVTLILKSDCYIRGLALGVEFKAEVFELPDIFKSLLLERVKIHVNRDIEVTIYFKPEVLYFEYTELIDRLKYVAEECKRQDLITDNRSIIDYYKISYIREYDISKFKFDTWFYISDYGHLHKSNNLTFCDLKERQVVAFTALIYKEWVKLGYNLSTWGMKYLLVFSDNYNLQALLKEIMKTGLSAILEVNLDKIRLDDISNFLEVLYLFDLSDLDITVWFSSEFTNYKKLSKQKYQESVGKYIVDLKEKGVEFLNVRKYFGRG